MTRPTFANAKPETLAAAILSGTFDDGSTFTLPTGGTVTATITNDGTFATPAKQDTGNTALAAIQTSTGDVDTNLGAKADTAASSDTGTFSLIAFVKRLLSVTLAKGQQAMAASLPVVIASDQSTLTVSQTALGTYSPIADATISSAAATQFPSGGPLSGRKGIYIFNNDAAIYLRWGDSTVTATKGGRIAPGTGITIMGSAAVYLYAESGSPTASGTEFK